MAKRLLSVVIAIFSLSMSASLSWPASTLVSARKPDGMILSEGNLYFTSHDASTATVWRTAQTSNPGQEIALYSESGARFGDIVFAKVNGSFFGYFFATTGNGGTITIKRVPLTGGTATVLKTTTNVDIADSHRNLITDGISLFWQDDQAIRRMPIGGGNVTILDALSPDTPTAGLALHGNNIIYAAGREIRYVPKSGAITSPAFRTIETATDTVTALFAVSNGVYWGERSGAVRVKVGNQVTTLPSIAGLVPTSIGTNGFTAGAEQAWTQCSNIACRMQFAFPAINFTSSIGADALGVTITSSGNVFWGDAAGVHRQSF
jgi:hypothetical protein